VICNCQASSGMVQFSPGIYLRKSPQISSRPGEKLVWLARNGSGGLSLEIGSGKWTKFHVDVPFMAKLTILKLTRL
jgi:hypothetical protein